MTIRVTGDLDEASEVMALTATATKSVRKAVISPCKRNVILIVPLATSTSQGFHIRH